MSSEDPTTKEPQVRVVDRRWWARGDTVESSDTEGLRKPSYVEDLERRLADLTTELQNHAAAHRRAQDEFDQIRARMKREAERDVERARRAVLVELLEVVDNLDRALAVRPATGNAVAASEQLEPLVQGVEMVRNQFLAKLELLGVTRIPALGERFDAARHEAVSTATVEDEARNGVVVAVIKEGYTIGDDLLRPAAVVVGHKA